VWPRDKSEQQRSSGEAELTRYETPCSSTSLVVMTPWIIAATSSGKAKSVRVPHGLFGAVIDSGQQRRST